MGINLGGREKLANIEGKSTTSRSLIGTALLLFTTFYALAQNNFKLIATLRDGKRRDAFGHALASSFIA
jgi:hypothetical protein